MDAQMNPFEEFMFDAKYVLRFYRVDHVLVCTINESMVSELRAVETKIRQQQAEIEALKEALSMKVILNEHAQQSMKGYKELLK
jgi:hypothetical protein